MLLHVPRPKQPETLYQTPPGARLTHYYPSSVQYGLNSFSICYVLMYVLYECIYI